MFSSFEAEFHIYLFFNVTQSNRNFK